MRVEDEKLTDTLVVTLPVKRTTCIRWLRELTEPVPADRLQSSFHTWRPDTKPYRGDINEDSFTIEPQVAFYRANGVPLPLLTGQVTTVDGKTQLAVRITAATGTLRVYTRLGIALALIIGSALAYAVWGGKLGAEGFLLLPLVIGLTLGIPYYLVSAARKSVRKCWQEFIDLLDKKMRR